MSLYPFVHININAIYAPYDDDRPCFASYGKGGGGGNPLSVTLEYIVFFSWAFWPFCITLGGRGSKQEMSVFGPFFQSASIKFLIIIFLVSFLCWERCLCLVWVGPCSWTEEGAEDKVSQVRSRTGQLKLLLRIIATHHMFYTIHNITQNIRQGYLVKQKNILFKKIDTFQQFINILLLHYIRLYFIYVLCLKYFYRKKHYVM